MLHTNEPRAAVKIPLPRALPKQTRAKVESAIEQHLQAVEALTAFLDEADGDPDEEPSLATNDFTRWSYSRRHWGSAEGVVDLEYDPADPPAGEGLDDNELDGPNGGGSDIEGSEHELGWPEMVNQDRALNAQRGWYHSGEPSLGSLDREINQNKWSRGGRRDMEADYIGFPDGNARSFTADMEPENGQ